MYDAILHEAVKPFCEKLRSAAEDRCSTCIMTHEDADGLIAASILCMTLLRLGAKCVIRVVSEPTAAVIEQMKSEAYDLYIICDLGSGLGSILNDAHGDEWIIIDHHQPSEDDFTEGHGKHILNAFKYGIDGGLEVSSGGLAFIIATQIEKRNWDLSPIALVSAISDRQDQGDKRTFVGINSEIMKIAQSHGLISVNFDLMFNGRETKPLHEALASTSYPYIHGITWNTENAYSVIKNSGVEMRENGRWRVPAEIRQEREKNIILDAVVKFVAASSKYDPESLKQNLVGHTYTLVEEDLRSRLRDAREFSTMLNACASAGRGGVAVGICMGDRNVSLNVGEQIAETHQTTLARCISTILAEKWRTTDDGRAIFVNAENAISEDMLTSASYLLSGPLNRDRMVFAWTASKDGMHKFSCRKCVSCKSGLNLGLTVRRCAEAVGGIGHGYAEAAVCKIPPGRLQEFVSNVKRIILDFDDSSA
jgi:single-stranded-DNA-specific exonuclease